MGPGVCTPRRSFSKVLGRWASNSSLAKEFMVGIQGSEPTESGRMGKLFVIAPNSSEQDLLYVHQLSLSKNLPMVPNLKEGVSTSFMQHPRSYQDLGS